MFSQLRTVSATATPHTGCTSRHSRACLHMGGETRLCQSFLVIYCISIFGIRTYNFYASDKHVISFLGLYHFYFKHTLCKALLNVWEKRSINDNIKYLRSYICSFPLSLEEVPTILSITLTTLNFQQKINTTQSVLKDLALGVFQKIEMPVGSPTSTVITNKRMV